jgi:hypothetical protein
VTFLIFGDNIEEEDFERGLAGAKEILEEFCEYPWEYGETG